MNAQKIVPKEIARAEQVSQQVHPLVTRQKRDYGLRELFFRSLIKELVKMPHRLRGVGCLRQKSRELFYHRHDHPKPLLLKVAGDLPPPAIGYKKGVVHVLSDTSDFHLVDVN